MTAVPLTLDPAAPTVEDLLRDSVGDADVEWLLAALDARPEGVGVWTLYVQEHEGKRVSYVGFFDTDGRRRRCARTHEASGVSIYDEPEIPGAEEWTPGAKWALEVAERLYDDSPSADLLIGEWHGGGPLMVRSA